MDLEFRNRRVVFCRLSWSLESVSVEKMILVAQWKEMVLGATWRIAVGLKVYRECLLDLFKELPHKVVPAMCGLRPLCEVYV